MYHRQCFLYIHISAYIWTHAYLWINIWWYWSDNNDNYNNNDNDGAHTCLSPLETIRSRVIFWHGLTYTKSTEACGLTGVNLPKSHVTFPFPYNCLPLRDDDPSPQHNGIALLWSSATFGQYSSASLLWRAVPSVRSRFCDTYNF